MAAKYEDDDEDSLDNRVTCSVCLESFTGRQPKILPCFHSFCLPCLSQLTQASQEGAGHEAACSTLICPACRKVVPVPSGGVAQFQSNFYIPDGGDQRPPACQLCEGQEDVHHHCNKCGHFCSRCHRIHAKFCSATVTSLLNTTATQPGSSKVGGQTGQSQVEALNAAIQRLEENTKEVKGQRDRLEKEAQARYMQGLSLLTQSHDRCLHSLREWGHTALDRLQAETDLAHTTRHRMASLPSLADKHHWTSDPDVQRFERYLKSCRKLALTFDYDDLTTFTSTQDWMKGFMGRVVMRDEAEPQQGQGSHSKGSVARPVAAAVEVGSDLTSASNVEDTASTVDSAELNADENVTTRSLFSSRPAADDMASTPLTANDMAEKLEALSRGMTKQDQKASSLESELKAVKQQNRQLQEDTSVLKREKQALMEDSTRLRREMSACREGVQTLKDKNSLLCQDLALLQTHNVQQVTKDLADLQKEVKDIARNKEEMVSENSKLKIAVSSAESKLSTLQTSVSSTETKLSTLQTSVSSTETKLSTLQTSVNQHDGSLAVVNQHLATARTKVAFHVQLHTNIRSVKTTRVLILKDETINMNNCYDTHTGYFTAPVSGMYLFMATAASDEEGKRAKLDIVHEGNDIAYLAGNYDTSCTGHVATRVSTGERVWLRTFKIDEDEVLSYQAGWMTSFCGVLIQPGF